MFDRIETLRMASSLTAHAAERQKLIAQNVANADTPGFRARDIADFSEVFEIAGDEMKRTRPGHLGSGKDAPLWAGTAGSSGSSPNGNSVSLETEMVKAAEVRREHDLALAVYGKSLAILRASLGRS